MASLVDAGHIGRRHAAGSNVASLLDRRAPAPLRNHARENVLAMRKKAQQLRGQSIIDSFKQPQPEFKLKQFANVKSRLHGLPCKVPAHALDLAEEESRSQDQNQEETEMDLATFERECERLKREHGGKAAKPNFQKDAAGRPAYLQRIKSNLAEQQREAEAQRAAPQVPPGYRQMPDDERSETLEALRKKREELDKAFQRLPFNIETDSQRRRQQNILDKIKESDAAIETFSKPNVLIEC